MEKKRWPINEPFRFDIIELHITYRCDLACVGCNRACFLPEPHTPDMNLADVVKFLDEMYEAGISIKCLKIIGGEPTLHPEFMAIVECLWERLGVHGVELHLMSNLYSSETRSLADWVANTFPAIQINPNVFHKQKTESVVFAEETRYAFCSPRDAWIDSPGPCIQMCGRSKGCGASVDKLGYTLCPVGGTIDSLLGLHARATKVCQMLDQGFVRNQAETLCAHCGMYLNCSTIQETWDHNGTPMSRSYHEQQR